MEPYSDIKQEASGPDSMPDSELSKIPDNESNTNKSVLLTDESVKDVITNHSSQPTEEMLLVKESSQNTSNQSRNSLTLNDQVVDSNKQEQGNKDEQSNANDEKGPLVVKDDMTSNKEARKAKFTQIVAKKSGKTPVGRAIKTKATTKKPTAAQNKPDATKKPVQNGKTGTIVENDKKTTSMKSVTKASIKTNSKKPVTTNVASSKSVGGVIPPGKRLQLVSGKAVRSVRTTTPRSSTADVLAKKKISNKTNTTYSNARKMDDHGSGSVSRNTGVSETVRKEGRSKRMSLLQQAQETVQAAKDAMEQVKAEEKKELENRKHDKSDKYNKDIANQGGKIEISSGIQTALKNLRPIERKKIEQQIMKQLTEERDELLSLRSLLKKQNENMLQQKVHTEEERNKISQEKAELEEVQRKQKEEDRQLKQKMENLTHLKKKTESAPIEKEPKQRAEDAELKALEVNVELREEKLETKTEWVEKQKEEEEELTNKVKEEMELDGLKMEQQTKQRMESLQNEEKKALEQLKKIQQQKKEIKNMEKDTLLIELLQSPDLLVKFQHQEQSFKSQIEELNHKNRILQEQCASLELKVKEKEPNSESKQASLPSLASAPNTATTSNAAPIATSITAPIAIPLPVSPPVPIPVLPPVPIPVLTPVPIPVLTPVPIPFSTTVQGPTTVVIPGLSQIKEIKIRPIPTTEMKPFHWGVIKDRDLAKESIWNSINDSGLDIDMGGLEKEFHKPKKEIKIKKRARGEKQATITFVANAISQNINIALKTLKENYINIRNWMLEMNEEKLPLGTLKKYIPLVPNEEGRKQTLEAIKEHKLEVQKDKVEQLGMTEKFWYHMITIPLVDERLNLWEFKMEFDEMHELQEKRVNFLMDAHDQLKDSECFQKILSVILGVGNYLNANSKIGGANGVRLDVLSKIEGLKSTDGGSNLLMFVYNLMVTKYPDYIDLHTDLNAIPEAAKVCEKEELDDLKTQVEEINKQVTNMLEKIKIIKQTTKKEEEANDKKKDDNTSHPEKPRDRFLEVMEPFSQEAQKTAQSLQKKFNQSLENLSTLAVCYGEKKDIPLDEFMKYFTDFLEAWGKSKEALRKIEAEKKKKDENGRQEKKFTTKIGQTNQQRIIARERNNENEEKRDARKATKKIGGKCINERNH